MQNCDEASPSIILAGRTFQVKMLITLEPHDIFSSNFAFLYTGMQDKDKTLSSITVAGHG